MKEFRHQVIQESPMHPEHEPFRKDLLFQIQRLMNTEKKSLERISVETKGYRRWSEDGIYCHRSGADCDACPIWVHYGRREGFGCHQPLANQVLLESHIPPTLEEQPGAIRTNPDQWGTHDAE